MAKRSKAYEAAAAKIDANKLYAPVEAVNLAKETLDLRFTPRPRERRLFSISLPIEISGTLADPTIDLGAELEAELARNQACQRALDRVSGN